MKGTVRSRSVGGVNLDLVCEALSLLADGHVSSSFVWHEYTDVAPFCLAEPSMWSQNVGDRLRPRKRNYLSHDLQTGEVTITPADDAPPRTLDEEDLGRIIEALRLSDRKLRIAVDRWCRSKRPEARLEDRYIDLRVALEALYLKDFGGERSQV